MFSRLEFQTYILAEFSVGSSSALRDLAPNFGRFLTRIRQDRVFIMRRKGRRQRSSPRRSSRRNAAATIPKVEIRGRKLKVSPHPPEFVPVPWFNVTLRMEGLTDLTSIGLILALKQQLRINTLTLFDVRIISVRGWGPLVAMNSTTSLQPLRVTFWSLFPGPGNTTAPSTYSIQEEVFDYPDQVRRAAVGYEYPLAQQQFVIRQTAQPILHITDGSGAGNVFYFRLLWRAKEVDLADFDSVSGTFIY